MTLSASDNAAPTVESVRSGPFCARLLHGRDTILALRLDPARDPGLWWHNLYWHGDVFEDQVLARVPQDARLRVELHPLRSPLPRSALAWLALDGWTAIMRIRSQAGVTAAALLGTWTQFAVSEDPRAVVWWADERT